MKVRKINKDCFRVVSSPYYYRVLHIDPDALLLVLSRPLTMMHSPNIILDPNCLIFRLSNEVSFVDEFHSEDG